MAIDDLYELLYRGIKKKACVSHAREVGSHGILQTRRKIRPPDFITEVNEGGEAGDVCCPPAGWTGWPLEERRTIMNPWAIREMYSG